jgi:hypothetical protein
VDVEASASATTSNATVTPIPKRRIARHGSDDRCWYRRSG